MMNPTTLGQILAQLASRPQQPGPIDPSIIARQNALPLTDPGAAPWSPLARGPRPLGAPASPAPTGPPSQAWGPDMPNMQQTRPGYYESLPPQIPAAPPGYEEWQTQGPYMFPPNEMPKGGDDPNMALGLDRFYPGYPDRMPTDPMNQNRNWHSPQFTKTRRPEYGV